MASKHLEKFCCAAFLYRFIDTLPPSARTIAFAPCFPAAISPHAKAIFKMWCIPACMPSCELSTTGHAQVQTQCIMDEIKFFDFPSAFLLKVWHLSVFLRGISSQVLKCFWLFLPKALAAVRPRLRHEAVQTVAVVLSSFAVLVI